MQVIGRTCAAALKKGISLTVRTSRYNHPYNTSSFLGILNGGECRRGMNKWLADYEGKADGLQQSGKERSVNFCVLAWRLKTCISADTGIIMQPL
jgi:hypothetical protein